MAIAHGDLHTEFRSRQIKQRESVDLKNKKSVSKVDITEEFKQTEPVSSSPFSKEMPKLERQGTVVTKDVEVVETGLPRRNDRSLIEEAETWRSNST